MSKGIDYILMAGVVGCIVALGRCCAPEPPMASVERKCSSYEDLTAPGWPAMGYGGDVSGLALPSYQLYVNDTAKVYSENPLRVLCYAPYKVAAYDRDRDTYTLDCASVNSAGDTVRGRWNNVCADIPLGAAIVAHPITKQTTAFFDTTTGKPRFSIGSVFYHRTLLDPWTGVLHPWTW